MNTTHSKLSLADKVALLEKDIEASKAKEEELKPDAELAQKYLLLQITLTESQSVIKSYKTIIAKANPNYKSTIVAKAINSLTDVEDNKSTFSNKAPFDYNCLEHTIKCNLTPLEVDAVSNFPNGTCEYLYQQGKLSASPQYSEVIALLHSLDKDIKIIKGFSLLTPADVAEILKITVEDVAILYKEKKLRGFNLGLNLTTLLFTWTDVSNYIGLTGKIYSANKKAFDAGTPEKQLPLKPHRMVLIKQAFYKAAYIALAQNQNFEFFFKNCLFGFNPYTSYYDKASSLVSKIEPSMGDFFEKMKGSKKGELSFRDWAEQYHPELIEVILNLQKLHGEDGFVKFASKFCLYGLSTTIISKLLNVTDLSIDVTGFNDTSPITKTSLKNNYYTPAQLGLKCGLGKNRAVRVNKCLELAGLQYKKDGDPKWYLTENGKSFGKTGKPLARKHPDSLILDTGKVIDTTNWKWDFHSVYQYISEAK
jgi:hypothetical protein